MKKIILLIPVVLMGLLACHNEKWEFPDYYYSTVYFPYQFPVRTLVLGDYETADNTNDNNLKFVISAHIGGMYKNNLDRKVSFQIVPDLANNLMTSLGDSLKALPSNYYTLSPIGEFTIPKGKFYGGFEVQLSEAFLDDTMAYRRHYVMPVQITSSSLDSILSGNTINENADVRLVEDWVSPPKNFTLFAIKYINPYHGKYLLRGQTEVRNSEGEVIQTNVYRRKFVEQDEISGLVTTGRNKVTVTRTVRQMPESPGSYTMDLIFDGNNNCVVATNPESEFPVTGTGKFVTDGDMWGNKARDVIHLDYKITVHPDTVHFVKDTLVVRDRDVRFEEFVPKIY